MGEFNRSIKNNNNSPNRTFRKYFFRGFKLEQLITMKTEEILQLFTSRTRRKIRRGLSRNALTFIKKLRKTKLTSIKTKASTNEKPVGIKTHLRSLSVVPEMIGCIIGIYNGKSFNGVEIKAEMMGMHLGEFSMSYKPVGHGRPGASSNHLTKYIVLK